MAPKVLIYGANNIGGAYAVVLSRAITEAHITVICHSNCEAVSKNGFTLHSTIWGRHQVARPAVTRSVQEAVKANAGAPFNFVIITSTVLPTTPSIPEQIRPAVTRYTTIVLIQNGIHTEAPFADAFPNNAILSTVAYLPIIQTEPGVIEHRGRELLHIGTYPASAHVVHKAAAAGFAALLAYASASTRVHDDVQTERWSKLLISAAWTSICVLTRLRDHQRPAADGYKDFLCGVLLSLMLEIAETARAYGCAAVNNMVVLSQLDRVMGCLLPGIQPSRMATALAGLNLEVEAILGNTLRLARAKGIHAPVLEPIYLLAVDMDTNSQWPNRELS